MAGPDARPSMQSPWNEQMPANVSPALRATRMWPSSVWFMPNIDVPRTMVPTPMPVPTVTYAKSSRPRAAPQRPSASAAPFTSVSKPTGTPAAAAEPSTPRRCRASPALVVDVMKPNVGEPARRSTGPNDAMPSARGAPYCDRQRSSTASICRSVSSRSPVGRRSTARTSSGPVPRMQTHLVPPNSTPASSLVGG